MCKQKSMPSFVRLTPIIIGMERALLLAKDKNENQHKFTASIEKMRY